MDLQTHRTALEIITSGWRASAVHAAVELGLPDHIAAGRTTSAELAAATGATEEGIRRLMRSLVAMDVFAGNNITGYRNTELSQLLLDEPESLRDMCLLCGGELRTAWGHLTPRSAPCAQVLNIRRVSR